MDSKKILTPESLSKIIDCPMCLPGNKCNNKLGIDVVINNLVESDKKNQESIKNLIDSNISLKKNISDLVYENEKNKIDINFLINENTCSIKEIDNLNKQLLGLRISSLCVSAGLLLLCYYVKK
jgi:hypothetical protein